VLLSASALRTSLFFLLQIILLGKRTSKNSIKLNFAILMLGLIPFCKQHEVLDSEDKLCASFALNGDEKTIR
jgi:hypothetical protein